MDYQEQYEKTLLEKEKLEFEFDQSRGRFKELYVECENQLHNEKENSRQLEIQVKELTRQVDSLKGENEGIRIAAKISEEANQEEYASLQAKHQEEIASLQHIWKEASHDYQSKLANDFRVERDKLLEANVKLEHRIRQWDDGNKGNNDGLVSMMTNALTSKRYPNAKGILDSPTASLENTQQQVQQDIDGWKSIVESLELEIKSLKSQLSEAKAQIKKHDAKYGSKSSSDKEVMLNEELKETQKYFESEKSARTDLEMYVAVLNTQKSVLQEDSDKLKAELHNVCRLFEQEKMSHNELKMTWKLANEQFLAQQNNIICELERTRKLLTTEQLEQLSSNSIDTAANQIKTVTEQSGKTFDAEFVMQRCEDIKASSNLIDFDSNGSSPILKPALTNDKNIPKKGELSYDKGSDKIRDSLFNTFFPAAYQARQFNELLLDSTKVEERPLNLSSSSEGEDDDIEKAIRIQNLSRYGVEEAEEVHEIKEGSSTGHIPNAFSNQVAILENCDNEAVHKKSSSTENIVNPTLLEPNLMQEKSLSQGDLSFTKFEYNSARVDKSDSIWNSVSAEYTRTCMMCQNYEKQLQGLQKDYMSITEKDNVLMDKLRLLQLELNAEKENYSTLEKTIDNAVGDSKCQLNIYETNQKEVDKQVDLLQTQFKQFQNDIICEIKTLTSKGSDEHD